MAFKCCTFTSRGGVTELAPPASWTSSPTLAERLPVDGLEAASSPDGIDPRAWTLLVDGTSLDDLL